MFENIEAKEEIAQSFFLQRFIIFSKHSVFAVWGRELRNDEPENITNKSLNYGLFFAIFSDLDVSEVRLVLYNVFIYYPGAHLFTELDIGGTVKAKR